jgi:very-short-patch-repair endonuclease
MTSLAEQTLAAQLEQAGIPFEAEYRFHPRRRWRADFVVPYPSMQIGSFIPYTALPQVLVEIDGGAFIGGRHSRGQGVANDCEKTSAAAILGYRVIRCTPAQVADGTALSWIQQALGLAEVAA